MALIDRLKERIETDLSDAELQAMIDEVAAEIEARFGANAAITVEIDQDPELGPYRRVLSLTRPIDIAQAIAVTEIEPADSGDAANETLLAADDYRVLDGGRTIQRLVDGSNGRTWWAPLVEVTYTPVSDTRQRDEVTIRVAQIEIQYRGLTSERAGDWQAVYPDAAAEREKLIAALSPRRGLVMA
jgi:hypothetical protein